MDRTSWKVTSVAFPKFTFQSQSLLEGPSSVSPALTPKEAWPGAKAGK
jgi:hypothetical protein